MEQATGSVLVSQEPGKLYGGWGAGNGPNHGHPKSTTNLRNSAGREGRTLCMLYLRNSYQQSDLNVGCSLTMKKNLLLRLQLLLIRLLSWTVSFLTRIGFSNRTSTVIAISWLWRSPVEVQNEAEPSFLCESLTHYNSFELIWPVPFLLVHCTKPQICCSNCEKIVWIVAH